MYVHNGWNLDQIQMYINSTEHKLQYIHISLHSNKNNHFHIQQYR